MQNKYGQIRVNKCTKIMVIFPNNLNEVTLILPIIIV